PGPRRGRRGMRGADGARSLDSLGPRSHTRGMGSAVRPSWVTAIVLALALFPSCTKSPPPLATVSDLRLSPAGITQHPWLGLSAEELQGRARERLGAGGTIAFRKEGEAAAPTDWKVILELVHVRALPSEPREAGSRAEV